MKPKHILISLFTIMLLVIYTPNIILADDGQTTDSAEPDIEDEVLDLGQNQTSEDIGDSETTENPDEEIDLDFEEDGEKSGEKNEETDASEPIDEESDGDLEESSDAEDEEEEADETDAAEEDIVEESDAKEEEDNKTEEEDKSKNLAKNKGIDLSGDEIIELKKKLTQLGFGRFPSNPSENYGTITAGVVKEFQKYYDLPTTGIANSKTLNKINEILASPYQDGKSGKDIKKLKKDLVRLGFATWSNPSENYGAITAGVVRDFQEFYALPISGIVDYKALDKIKKILEPPYQDGDRGEPVVELKRKLVKLGFASWKNPSPNYGSITAGVVKDFQQAYQLTPADGVAGADTLNKLDEVLANGKYQSGDKGDDVVF